MIYLKAGDYFFATLDKRFTSPAMTPISPASGGPESRSSERC
jgi:hypothetical protein